MMQRPSHTDNTYQLRPPDLILSLFARRLLDAVTRRHRPDRQLAPLVNNVG